MEIEPGGQTSPEPGNSLLARVTGPLALAGGVLLFAAATLVVVSVVLRWTTSFGITGDFEVVQIALAVSAFAFLPYCQARRGNILVETFTQGLPARLQAGLDGLWDLAYAGFAAVIAWRLAVGALETVRTRTTSMVLELPVGWAIGLCAAIAALLAVTALATGLAKLAGRS